MPEEMELALTGILPGRVTKLLLEQTLRLYDCVYAPGVIVIPWWDSYVSLTRPSKITFVPTNESGETWHVHAYYHPDDEDIRIIWYKN